ncbi:MAG: cytidine deaminase [Patescibacteria group bacterium]
MINLTFNELGDEEKELLNEAEKAITDAYNPYNSQARIGAAVCTKSNKIITGSNIANVSSTVNLCAERAAFAAANAEGHRDIIALAIIGTDEDGVIEDPIMPCGVCRQFMEEYLTINGEDISVICSNSSKSKIIKTSLKELLPLPYAGSGEKK